MVSFGGKNAHHVLCVIGIERKDRIEIMDIIIMVHQIIHEEESLLVFFALFAGLDAVLKVVSIDVIFGVVQNVRYIALIIIVYI